MDERWIWAGVAIGGGVLLGVIVGGLVRRSLGLNERRPALRKIAGPLSLFLFWLFAATGIVLAIAVSSPETLKPIPADILDWLPNVALAGLLVIGGYALGSTIATTVGRAVGRAAGERQRGLEAAVRVSVLTGAIILALSQLGVDTTVLNILIGGLVFGIAAALAGISIVGGRSVSGHVAAGRTLQHALQVGTSVRVGGISGEVVETQIAHVILRVPSGRVMIPYGTILDQPIHLVDAAELSDEDGDE